MNQPLNAISAACSLALLALCHASWAADPPVTASIAMDASHRTGGPIPERYLGISIEWTLTERYMNPNARPTFVNLLRNLGSGFIRVGGGSQETIPYRPDAVNTDSVTTLEDFRLLRTTVDALNTGVPADAVPKWGVVLGVALGSGANTTVANTTSFVQGIATTFAGSERYVAGIGMGNEPDFSGPTFANWLNLVATHSNAAVSGNWPLVFPNTSNDIVPWTTLADQANPSRWFWNWPQILQATATTVKARAGVFGPWVSDHFYPLARTCTTSTPWRCPSIGALLSKEHMDTLDYQAYTHINMAAPYGIPYRMEETSTSARQGAPGVSDVAASAAYGLDMMFHVACPQPPHLPGANVECTTCGSGVNLQNAARNGNTNPEQGNAYYNVINFDSSAAMGPPTAAPIYYSALLFAHLAQGTSGLRPVSVTGESAAGISAWRLEAGAGERRLFMINKSTAPITVNVSGSAARVLVNRMTPYDPTNSGKTLDSTAVVVDGRQMNADGTWPGFAATSQALQSGATSVTIAAGEAVVFSEFPQIGARMVPSVQNLRTRDGVATVVLTAASGDLSYWDLGNLRLQGTAPLSAALTADGRSVVATFAKGALASLPAGNAVPVTITGNLTRDGLVSPFTANTVVTIVR